MDGHTRGPQLELRVGLSSIYTLHLYVREFLNVKE